MFLKRLFLDMKVAKFKIWELIRLNLFQLFSAVRQAILWVGTKILGVTNADKPILDKYHTLNDNGKQRLLERADELIELGYVTKGDVLKEA